MNHHGWQQLEADTFHETGVTDALDMSVAALEHVIDDVLLRSSAAAAESERRGDEIDAMLRQIREMMTASR